MCSLPVRLLQSASFVCDAGDEQTWVRMLTLAFPLSRPLMGGSGRVRQAGFYVFGHSLGPELSSCRKPMLLLTFSLRGGSLAAGPAALRAGRGFHAVSSQERRSESVFSDLLWRWGVDYKRGVAPLLSYSRPFWSVTPLLACLMRWPTPRRSLAPP